MTREALGRRRYPFVFEIFRRRLGWYWRLKHGGKIMAIGAEPFSSLANVKRSIKHIPFDTREAIRIEVERANPRRRRRDRQMPKRAIPLDRELMKAA